MAAGTELAPMVVGILTGDGQGISLVILHFQVSLGITGQGLAIEYRYRFKNFPLAFDTNGTVEGFGSFLRPPGNP